MRIETKNLSGPAPLYQKYPGQTEPQGAYITISPAKGTVRADWNGEIGSAVPFGVYQGRILRVPVPFYAHGPSLARELESEPVRVMFERIVAGHSVEWDGSNHVGRLTDDARAAVEELEARLQDVPQTEVWDAADWYSSDDPPPIEADTTDEQIMRMAAELDAEASPTSGECPAIIITGSAEYFLEVRNGLRQEAIDAQDEE